MSLLTHEPLGGMAFCPLCKSAYDFPRSLQISGDFARLIGLSRSPQRGKSITTERIMAFYRTAIGASTLVAALSFMLATALAHDETRYPDWSGQWKRPPGVGHQWDQTKRPGLAQQAPLTPEYQAIFEAGLADQAAGGQGGETRHMCLPNGMPRMMTAVQPIEFVILPIITYVNFENNMPRRIYTDGRDWPDDAPSFAGYSIGKWTDADGDGRYDLLEVETRNLKGPRRLEASGLPLHDDNQSIIKERIYLDRV